jgi:hypothetical protein
MPRIEFVFFDAGGGHRAAVSALESAIRDQQWPWQVRLTNLQEVLDPLDLLKRVSGIRIQDTYNAMLRRGWTLGSVPLLRLLQSSIRLSHRRIVEMLEQHWRESRPDQLVSCVPNFNRALRESFQNVFPGRPFVTILTDMADFPPHFWIEPEPQHFICGTERAVEQALAAGHPPERVFGVSGMILHPRFYQAPVADRRSERQRLGLDPDLHTALVMFGGHGSKAMLEIARRLDRSGLALQLILICGRNLTLAEALHDEISRVPCVVEGFTIKVCDYMRLADFFIGKPGPGSVSEALAMRLPVVIASNAWTLPQERYNAQWITENQVGLVLPNFRKIESAVAKMIDPVTLARYRANTAKFQNRALFEIPGILSRILNGNATEAPGSVREAVLSKH